MASKPRFSRALRRTVAVAAAGLTLSAALAGCSSSAGGGAETGNASDIKAALDKGGSITVWTWGTPVKKVADKFEQKYPKVHVKVVNAGTGNAEYTKLQNAIKAGSGAPDIAQIEYYALPQFILGKSLANLEDFGFDSYEDDYTASTWNSVSTDDGVWGLPQDSGPMVMYYNKAVFDQYGLTVPTTWDEYIETAKKLHAADPSKYITSDSGDAGFTTSMIWQAGGKPYATSGTDKVTIDLQDDGAKKWTSKWNQLLDGGLLSPIVGWSDEWYQALGDGTLATLISGAWMPANFESGITASAGDWRVAPIPTYEKGQSASAENGGSSDAILKQSKNKLLAAGFLDYMNHDPEGVKIQIDAGSFPSTTADLESKSFLDYKSDYFGGQEINKVLVQASKDVVKGWSYLPFQVYSNSIFGDTVGQSYADKGDINDGLKNWQKQTASYGDEQGFTVTSK
jgi:multiple sugar transport system substrate-binding protein